MRSKVGWYRRLLASQEAPTAPSTREEERGGRGKGWTRAPREPQVTASTHTQQTDWVARVLY